MAKSNSTRQKIYLFENKIWKQFLKEINLICVTDWKKNIFLKILVFLNFIHVFNLTLEFAEKNYLGAFL